MTNGESFTDENNIESLRPIAYTISDWDFREILYSCRKCGADFRILSAQEKYCHRCGQKQNWDVILELPARYKTKWAQIHNSGDIDGETKFMQSINEINNFKEYFGR